MASVVAEIEKAVQNKFLSEELYIETKLHQLTLNSRPKSEIGQTNPEEERNRENQAALKRNKDLLKETDLIVARYRSRSLYSPVDGHLEAWKLKFLKQQKELKHKEQLKHLRQPPEPESVNLFIGGQTFADVHPVLQSIREASGISKKVTKPVAYLVTGADNPTPLPRSSLLSTVRSMRSANLPTQASKSTPASAGLTRIAPGTGAPTAPDTTSYRGVVSRQVKSSPAAGLSRATNHPQLEDPNASLIQTNAI